MKESIRLAFQRANSGTTAVCSPTAMARPRLCIMYVCMYACMYVYIYMMLACVRLWHFPHVEIENSCRQSQRAVTAPSALCDDPARRYVRSQLCAHTHPPILLMRFLTHTYIHTHTYTCCSPMREMAVCAFLFSESSTPISLRARSHSPRS
jgi:hypothetical protein